MTRLWLGILFISVIIFNLGLSFSLPQLGLDFVLNDDNGRLIRINRLIFVLILMLLFGALWKMKMLRNKPWVIALALAASLSNSLEYSLMNGVKDYINIGIAYINTADIQLLVSGVLIIYRNWWADIVTKFKK